MFTSIGANTQKNEFSNIGKLAKFLKESKHNDISNSVIEEVVKELEYPSKTYVLVKLPNIELSINIKVANGFFLISDTVYLDRFLVDDKKGDFNFRLERGKSYLLIEETGRLWNYLNISESLIYKNILLKLKTFLGLLLISNIVTTKWTIDNITESKGRTSVPIGIFSDSPGIWSENLPYDGASEEEEKSGIYDPLSEDHLEYKDLKDLYSQGDVIREFFFQKAFHIEEEINISPTYADFIKSLSINEYATKTSFSLITGGIEKPLPQFGGITPTKKRPKLGSPIKRIVNL